MKATESKYSKCIYFSSNALARKMEKLAQQSWKEVSLSTSHAYLLMLVIERPGLQPTEITEELLLTPSTITRLIEKLEAKKLVVRTAEGKTTNVYPTPRGKQLLPQLMNCNRHFIESCNKVLGKEENTRLVQSMNQITDKLMD